MDQLFKVLKTYPSASYVTEQMADFLRQEMEPLVFNKDEIIYNEEMEPDSIYFLDKGLTREMYFKSSGRMLTRSFKREGQFIINSNPFMPDGIRDNELKMNIEALENSILWILPGSAMQRMYNLHQHVDMLHIDIIMKTSMIDKNHYRVTKLATPQERYDFVRTRMPDMLRRVEAKHIASFMDVPMKVFLELDQASRLKESN